MLICMGNITPSFYLWIHFIIAALQYNDIDGLVLERRNSGALEMELRLSCINPPVWVNVVSPNA